MLAFKIGLSHAEFGELSPGQFWDRVEGYEYQRETQMRDLASLFLSVIGAHTKGRVTLDKLVPPTIGRTLRQYKRGRVWFESEHKEDFASHARNCGFKAEVLEKLGVS